MTRHRLRVPICAALLLVALVLIGGCSSVSTGAARNADGQVLVGAFRLDPGTCHGSNAAGTYFRMIVPGGSIQNGKFFDNPDSTCGDKSYTLAAPGTDGGFFTAKYQPNPSPAFDTSGNSRVGRIVAPQGFTAIDFGISTDPVDPQTGRRVPPPSIATTNGTLSGQVQAWSAAWNNQYFNQGSPKPDGTRPGLTTPVSGTYDGTTHAFVLIWSSQVVGGPFNGFTGYWHLQGKFVPSP